MRRRSSMTPTRMHSLFFMPPLRSSGPARSLADHRAGQAQQVIGFGGLALLAQIFGLLDGGLGLLRRLGRDDAGLEGGLSVLERLVAALHGENRRGNGDCDDSEEKRTNHGSSLSSFYPCAWTR